MQFCKTFSTISNNKRKKNSIFAEEIRIYRWKCVQKQTEAQSHRRCKAARQTVILISRAVVIFENMTYK